MPLNTGHVLTTARMTLADVTAADFAAIYAMDKDPLVLRHIGDGTGETRSFDDFCAHFRARIESWMSPICRMWVMRLQGSDAVLGIVFLKPVKDTRYVEVGYRMPQSSWGKGYATEAARAAIGYGFDVGGLAEITAVTHPDNAASQQVLMKCGLTRDGTLNYNGRGEIPFFRLTRSGHENLSIPDGRESGGHPVPTVP
jgi:[ribosomal protein S5]-alanine N-acetyltransferase